MSEELTKEMPETRLGMKAEILRLRAKLDEMRTEIVRLANVKNDLLGAALAQHHGTDGEKQ